MYRVHLTMSATSRYEKIIPHDHIPLHILSLFDSHCTPSGFELKIFCVSCAWPSMRSFSVDHLQSPVGPKLVAESLAKSTRHHATSQVLCGHGKWEFEVATFEIN